MFSQRGQAGELRAGPFVAARFGAWSLERPDETLGSDVATIRTGPVLVKDTYRFDHDPLDLWLDCEKAWWVWRDVIDVGDGWRTRGGRPEIRIK